MNFDDLLRRLLCKRTEYNNASQVEYYLERGAHSFTVIHLTRYDSWAILYSIKGKCVRHDIAYSPEQANVQMVKMWEVYGFWKQPH